MLWRMATGKRGWKKQRHFLLEPAVAFKNVEPGVKSKEKPVVYVMRDMKSDGENKFKHFDFSVDEIDDILRAFDEYR